MAVLTRRSLLRGSLALGVAGALARPHVADAAATTATAWWVQGFAEEEDVAFKKIVADYQKASGNTIEYSIVPYAPLRQKIVSAVTSGVVPDLFQNNPGEILALFAWQGKLVEVGDVIETQKGQYNETALLTAYCYNNGERRRGYYGVPYTSAVRPNHIWRPLVEKAGYTMEDLPRTWDAYYDFFKEVQKKLRFFSTLFQQYAVSSAVSVYSSRCVSTTSVRSTSLSFQANSAMISWGWLGNTSGTTPLVTAEMIFWRSGAYGTML